MSPHRDAAVPIVDYARCQICAQCVAAEHCRYRALARFDREEPPYIDLDLCGGCGECMPFCPSGAIVPPSGACGAAGE
jgi:MinD superfamily P-loop ATPase